jgi:hypothetical protein
MTWCELERLGYDLSYIFLKLRIELRQSKVAVRFYFVQERILKEREENQVLMKKNLAGTTLKIFFTPIVFIVSTMILILCLRYWTLPKGTSMKC